MILWLFGAMGLVAAWWAARSTRRTLHPVRRPLAVSRPLPAFETVSWNSRHGEPFDGWLLTAAPAKGLVVGCHGYHANRLQLLEIAEGLQRRSYTVVLFDLRGHGSRPGPCTFGVKDVEDLGVILTWIRRQPALAMLPVGFFGMSLGGAVSVQAAALHGEGRAIALDSTYARLFPVLARVIRRDHHLPAVPWAWITWAGVQLALRSRLATRDPAALAGRCRIPLLHIHGADDPTVPLAEGTELYLSWPGPKERWVEPQAGHAGTHERHPAAYVDRLASFFDRWLPAARHSSGS